MQNICIPLFEDGDHVTGQVTSAVIGKRFLKVSADVPSGPGVSDATDGGKFQVAQAGAGEQAIAVAEWDQPTVGGDTGLVGEPGMIVPVEAGAAIAAGAEVQSDASGRAITLAGGKSLGVAMAAASGAGVDCFVKLRV